jgi:MoxR-like ATPase
MGDAQSAHVSGKTTLFERISEDIGSGNEGDMIDMQCTVNVDPDVSPAPLLMKKDITDQGQDLGMRSM